jgi:hypothetical protein
MRDRLGRARDCFVDAKCSHGMCKRVFAHHLTEQHSPNTHTKMVQNGNNVDVWVSILETQLIFDIRERYWYVCLPTHMGYV